MDVGDVLRDRLQPPIGFERMVLVSILVHGALLAIVILTPGRWLSLPEQAPKTVMTISLDGGNGGPASGGLTAIGGKAVQAETPPDAKRPEPVQAPAAKTPEMTVPIPNKTPVKPSARPAVTRAP